MPDCPNCGKPIELLSGKNLADKYGITPNALQYARDRGKFPEPWMRLGNRDLYLEETIQEYVSDRGRAKVQSTVKDLLGVLSNLPDEDAAEARKLLAEQLGEPKRRQRAK